MTNGEHRAPGAPIPEALERALEEALEVAATIEPSPIPQPAPVPRHDRRRRVVITGVGAMTPLGESPEAFWRGLVDGRSGVGPMTQADPSNYSCRVAGEVRTFDPRNYLDAKDARRMARFTQLAVAAAGQAIADSGVDLAVEDRDRVGVLIGNGNGGFPTLEEEFWVMAKKGGHRVSPLLFPMTLPNMAASQISLRWRLGGYSSTVTTACAAANQAIGEAVELIRRGGASVMITGGTEAGISELGLAGFANARALATENDPPERASCPFDKRRTGFVPAEGAAIFVIEDLEHALAREATIYAEITGYGASADAYHLVAPEPEGRGAARAMLQAITDAGLTPNDIDAINAHATSTELGDIAETVAIKRVFGERAYAVPVSAVKSMVGHALGAAGALGALACIMSLRDQILHPTINLDQPDPACDLDYVPNVARPATLRHVLANSFGFGGQNACLVFSKFELR